MLLGQLEANEGGCPQFLGTDAGSNRNIMELQTSGGSNRNIRDLQTSGDSNGNIRDLQTSGDDPHSNGNIIEANIWRETRYDSHWIWANWRSPDIGRVFVKLAPNWMSNYHMKFYFRNCTSPSRIIETGFHEEIFWPMTLFAKHLLQCKEIVKLTHHSYFYFWSYALMFKCAVCRMRRHVNEMQTSRRQALVTSVVPFPWLWMQKRVSKLDKDLKQVEFAALYHNLKLNADQAKGIGARPWWQSQTGCQKTNFPRTKNWMQMSVSFWLNVSGKQSRSLSRI